MVRGCGVSLLDWGGNKSALSIGCSSVFGSGFLRVVWSGDCSVIVMTGPSERGFILDVVFLVRGSFASRCLSFLSMSVVRGRSFVLRLCYEDDMLSLRMLEFLWSFRLMETLIVLLLLFWGWRVVLFTWEDCFLAERLSD